MQDNQFCYRDKKERRSGVIAALRSGERQRDIAARFGLHETTVSWIGRQSGLRRYSYAPRPAPPKATPIAHWTANLAAANAEVARIEAELVAARIRRDAFAAACAPYAIAADGSAA